MLISRIYTPKTLPWVPVAQWREPSRAQNKDAFGRQDSTRFRIRGQDENGRLRTLAWFEDRNDADAFFTAVLRTQIEGAPFPPELRHLPYAYWDAPVLPDVSYHFDTVVTLTAPTGSNQVYTSPVDWDNINNAVHVIGGGASGGKGSRQASGGGGGAYSGVTGFSFAVPGTTTATYRIGTGGAGVSSSTEVNGTTGGDSWFNGATLAGSSCGAKGGTRGLADSTAAGGAGGAAASGTGTTKYSGGDGGSLSGTGTGSSGGGGAAGPSGDGGNGTSLSTSASAVATNGGSANSGAVAGGTGSAASTSVLGSTQSLWDASVGPGSGSGGCSLNTSASVASSAVYGAASGGRFSSSGSASSGDGAQGIIVLIYTPRAPNMFMVF